MSDSDPTNEEATRVTTLSGKTTALELWHNPRCSKSRQAKELLDAKGIAYVERRYLAEPPTIELLDRVLIALHKDPWEATRLGEPLAESLDMRGWAHDRALWLAAMVENPILIERPILVADHGSRAALGRPPEQILDLL